MMGIKRIADFESPSRLVEQLQEILHGAFWESREEAVAAWTAICQLECVLDSAIIGLMRGKELDIKPEIDVTFPEATAEGKKLN